MKLYGYAHGNIHILCLLQYMFENKSIDYLYLFSFLFIASVFFCACVTDIIFAGTNQKYLYMAVPPCIYILPFLEDILGQGSLS